MPSFTEKLKVSGKEMSVYASVPSGSGPFPAVVVAQHGGGVDTFIKSICDRLAKEGYAAVAPELYHRITEDMVKSSGKTRRELLNDVEIIADVNTTVDWLRGHKSIDRERIGVTGFCMGGRVTWLAAATNPHFKAAVPHYGGNIMQLWGKGEKPAFELASGIKCPILFHFGELDENPSQADMRKLDAELTRLKKTHQFITWPGANHAFMDHTGQRYVKSAAEGSWPKTLEFFATHLKKAAAPAKARS
ncbi:MAG: dienelactone hydrolase family protein [Dehalococcoidia bacterium]|nr:dienelactone hydrolase family protein [Dehalococcoidia bacterium]MSQ16475.1 dienelactone hydrolase family protein [Dehalococcoidia bacterium]